MTGVALSKRPLVASTISLLLAMLVLFAAFRLNADSRVLLLVVVVIFVLVPLLILLALSLWLARLEPLRSTPRRMMVAVPLAALILVLSYCVLVASLDARLANSPASDAYADCHKVWSTRGLVVGAAVNDVVAGNRIATVLRAFEHGARGVEIDAFYDVASGGFVVSHDRPYELKDGRLLHLEELLAVFPAQAYAWIDLKKLRHLSRAEARTAAETLRRLVFDAGLDPRHVYVEGADPFNLGAFRDIGLATIFDVYPLPDAHPLGGLVLDVFKAAWHFGGFTVLSTNYDLDGEVILGTATLRRLRTIPLFVYHVPDNPELLQRLSDIPNVRVLLDHDHGADRFDINACPSQAIPAATRYRKRAHSLLFPLLQIRMIRNKIADSYATQ